MLKLVSTKRCLDLLTAAASARLSVETASVEGADINYGAAASARLSVETALMPIKTPTQGAAASARLSVETLDPSDIEAVVKKAAASARLCVETTRLFVRD